MDEFHSLKLILKAGVWLLVRSIKLISRVTFSDRLAFSDTGERMGTASVSEPLNTNKYALHIKIQFVPHREHGCNH